MHKGYYGILAPTGLVAWCTGTRWARVVIDDAANSYLLEGILSVRQSR
jgi:hypothetical protein